MYLSNASRSNWNNRDGSQHASGFFLVLMTPVDDHNAPVRGLVRSVKLHQLGHFMMGKVKINIDRKFYDFSVSGSYGADGLTVDVPREVYNLGVELPGELWVKWNQGGGHNSCGSEAPDMDKWAKTLMYPASTYRKKK